MIISPQRTSPFSLPFVGGTPPFSFGNALEFDGTDDFGTFTNIPFSSYTNASFNFWFKINTFGTDIMWGSGSDILINFPRILSATSLRVGREVGGFFNFTVPDISSGWQMCTITKSGSNYRLYINAVESTDGAQSIAGTININRTGTTYGFFDGLYDEAAIWNGYTLTQTDITNLFNGGSGDFATNYQDANLIAYWRFNEEDGATTAVDEKGTYNMTLNNFSTPPAYFVPHV